MDAFQNAATFYAETYGDGREPASLPKETSGRLARLSAWLERALQLELTHWARDEQTGTWTDTRRVYDTYQRFLFFYFATIAALSESRGVLANLAVVKPARTALMTRLGALSRHTTDLVKSFPSSLSSSSSEAERFTETLECLLQERLVMLGLDACLSVLELGDAWITPLVALLLEQLRAGYTQLGQVPAAAMVFQKTPLQAHWLDTLSTWILMVCRAPDAYTQPPIDVERMSAERQISWTRSHDHLKSEPSERLTDCLTCSFQRTGRQFQAQHWYRCATCSFGDDEGICTACALVCHAGHEVSYARFSSFFCDCGSASTDSTVVCRRLSTTESIRKQASCSAPSQITPSQHDHDLEKRTESALGDRPGSEVSLPDVLREPAHDLFAFMARFPVAMEQLWQSWASAYLAKMSIRPADRAAHVPSITAPLMEHIGEQLLWLRQEALHPSLDTDSQWKGPESFLVSETNDTRQSDISSSTAAVERASIGTATETGRQPTDPTEHNAVPIQNASASVLFKRLEWTPCATQILTRVRHLDQAHGRPCLGMDMCLDPATNAANLKDTKRLEAPIDPSLVFADGLVMVIVPGLGTHDHQIIALDPANVAETERTGRSFPNEEEAVAGAAPGGALPATRTWNPSSSSPWLSTALDTRSWERLPLGICAGTIRFSGAWRRPGRPQRLLVMNHESSTLRLFYRHCPASSTRVHPRNDSQANHPFFLRTASSWNQTIHSQSNASSITPVGAERSARESQRASSATTIEISDTKTWNTQAQQASSAYVAGPSSKKALAAVALQHWQHSSETDDVPYLPLPLPKMVTSTAYAPISDSVEYASGSVVDTSSPSSGPRSFENTAFVEATAAMNRSSTGATQTRWSSASTGANVSSREPENRTHNADTQRAWMQHLLLERKALDNGQAIEEASWLDAYADDWLLLLGQQGNCIEVCSLSYVCCCWICRLIRSAHGEHHTASSSPCSILGEPSPSIVAQTEAAPTLATRTEHLEWLCWDAAPDTGTEATTCAARVQGDGSVSPLDAWMTSSSSSSSSTNDDDSATAAPLVHNDQQVFETTTAMATEPCWAPDASAEHDPWRMACQRRFVLDWNQKASLEAVHSTPATTDRGVSASTEPVGSPGEFAANVHARLQAWTHGRVVLDARDVSLSPPGRLLLFLMLADHHLLVYGYVAAPWTTSGSPTEDAVLLSRMQLPPPNWALTVPAAHTEQGTSEVSSATAETSPLVTSLYYDDAAQELDLFWSNGYWSRWRVRWLANNVRDSIDCSGEDPTNHSPVDEDEQTSFWSWSIRKLFLEPVAEKQLLHLDAVATTRLQSVQPIPVLSSGNRSYTTDRRLFLLLLHSQPELSMVWLPKTNVNEQQCLRIHDVEEEPALSGTSSTLTPSDALDRTLVVWTPSLDSVDAFTDRKRRMEHHLAERCRQRRWMQATGVAFWQLLPSGDAFSLGLDLALVYEDGTVMGLMTSLSWPFNGSKSDPFASLQVPGDCNRTRGVMTSSVREHDPLKRLAPLSASAERTHWILYSSDQTTRQIESSSAVCSTHCDNVSRLGTATIWPLNKDGNAATATTEELRPENSTILVLADQRTNGGCLVGFFDALEQVPNEALSFSGDFWRLGLSSVASVVQWANRWPRATSGSPPAMQTCSSSASGDARFRNAEHVPEALFWQIAPVGPGRASVASAQLVLEVTTMEDASWALLGIRLAWLRIRSSTGDACSGAAPLKTVEVRGNVDGVHASFSRSLPSSRLRLTPLEDPKAALPADIQGDWLWMECCCDDAAVLSLNPSCRQVTLTVPEASSWSSPAWLVLGTVQVYGLRLSSPVLDRWLRFLNWRQEHPPAAMLAPETSPESSSSCDSVKAARPMVQQPSAYQVRSLLSRAWISICLALVNGCGSDSNRPPECTELEQRWHALLLEGMLWGQAQRHRQAPYPTDECSEQQQVHHHDDGWQQTGWLGRYWPRVMHLLERVWPKHALLLTSRWSGKGLGLMTPLDMALERFANTERQQASRYAKAMCALFQVAERDTLASFWTDVDDAAPDDIRPVYQRLANIALSWAVQGLVALVATATYLSTTSTEHGFQVRPWKACACIYIQTAVLFWHELEANQSDGDILVHGFVRAAGTFLEWLACRQRPLSEWSLETESWLFEPFALHPQDRLVVSFLNCWLGAAKVDERPASSQRQRLVRWQSWSRWLVATLLQYPNASPEDGHASSSNGNTTKPNTMGALDLERRLCLLVQVSLDLSRADGHWQILLQALSVLASRSRPNQVMRTMAVLARDQPALHPLFGSLAGCSSTWFRCQRTVYRRTVLETLWLVTADGAGRDHALVTERCETLPNVFAEAPPRTQTQTGAGVVFDSTRADVTWPQTAFEVWIRRFQQQWRADTPVGCRQWLDAYASLVLAAFCLQRLQSMQKDTTSTALIGQRGGSRADALLYATIESIEVALWDWFGIGVQFCVLHQAPPVLQLLLGVLVPSADAVQAAMAVAAWRQILYALEHSWHPCRGDCSASLPSSLGTETSGASTYWDRWQRQQRIEQAAVWLSAANHAELGDYGSRSLSSLLPRLLQLLTSALAHDDHRSARGVLRLLQAIRNVPGSTSADLARACWNLLQTLMMHPRARQKYHQAVVSLLVRVLDVAACSTTRCDAVRREPQEIPFTWLKSLVQRYAILYGLGPFSSTGAAVDEMIDLLLKQLETIADQHVSLWTSTVSHDNVHDLSTRRSLQPSVCSDSDPDRVLDLNTSSWHAASLVCPDCRDDARRWLVSRHGTAAVSLLAGKVQRQSLQTLASQLRYDDYVLEATWQVPCRLRRLSIRMLRCRTTLVIYGIRVHFRRALTPIGGTCSNDTDRSATRGEATTQGPLRHRPQVIVDASNEWICCFEILYRQNGSILAVLSRWTAQPERQPADWGVATGLRLEFLRSSGRTLLPETVSCPRCARLVTERGGICPGCKENVYQCRACRFIDYGRLNALLCRECGHSRYLRYEVEVETSAVDPLHQVQSRAARRRGQELAPLSSSAPTVTPQGVARSPTRDAGSATPQSSETRDAQSRAGADPKRSSAHVPVDASTSDDLLVGLGADERAAALQDWWSNAGPVQTLPLECGRCAVRRQPALWRQLLESMQRAAPMSVIEWQQRLAPLLKQLLSSSFSRFWSQQQQQQQQQQHGFAAKFVLDPERTMQWWPRHAKQAWMQLLEEASFELGMDTSSAEALFDWRRAIWQSLEREICAWERLPLPSPVNERDLLFDTMAGVDVVASPVGLFPDRALYLAALYGQRWRMRSGQRLLEQGRWAKCSLRPSRLVATGTLWPALFHPYAPAVRRWALGVLVRHPRRCLGLFNARVLLYGCLQVERHGHVDLMEAYWQLWRWLWQQQEAWIVFWDACGGLELLCVVVLGIARGLTLEDPCSRMPAGALFCWAPYLRQRLLEEWIRLIREAVERIRQLHWTRTAFRSLLRTFEVLYCEDSYELAAQLANIIRHVTERAPLLARWQARWMVDRLKRHTLSAFDENNADDPFSD